MLSYRIDGHRRLIMATASGRLTIEQALDHLDRLTNDPEFDPSFRLLGDYRNATFSELTPEFLRRIVDRAVTIAAPRRAYVVSSETQAGIVRVAKVYGELAGRSGEVRLFDDIDAATAWLLAEA